MRSRAKLHTPCYFVPEHLARWLIGLFGVLAPAYRSFSEKGSSRVPNKHGMGLVPSGVLWLGMALAVAGCAMDSDVMDTGNGTYMISAHAAPIRGGAAGANRVAYKDANTYCGQQGAHAVVLTADARDVYQGSVAGSGGTFGGGIFAAGNTDLHFRCDK